MTPLERADRVRELLDPTTGKTLGIATARNLLPPGSLILTPDEAWVLSNCLRWRTSTKSERALLAGKGQT